MKLKTLVFLLVCIAGQTLLSSALAQSHVITGKVTSQTTNEPLASVTVTVKGTTINQ